MKDPSIKFHGFRYLVFYGLKNLKEIVGAVGIDCRADAGGIVGEPTPVRKVPPGPLALQLEDRTGKIIPAGKASFRAMAPGDVRRLKFPLPKSAPAGSRENSLPARLPPCLTR